MVNDITSDTMLIVYLKEAFTNEFEEVAEIVPPVEEPTEEGEEEENLAVAAIEGPDSVYPFDEIEYSIKNAEDGV